MTRGAIDLSAHPLARRAKRLKPHAPVKPGQAYSRIWRIVDGAVRDAFASHPEYIEKRWMRAARFSITKRVTGEMMSFAAQSAKGREAAADTGSGRLGPQPYGWIYPAKARAVVAVLAALFRRWRA